MDILESAMAFAVVMIILSTIATGITELYLRLRGTREKNLEATVDALFRQILWPRLKDRLDKSGETDISELSTVFVKEMTGNPTLNFSTQSPERRTRKYRTWYAKSGAWIGGRPGWAWETLGRLWRVLGRLITLIQPSGNPGKVSALSPLAFAERLGRTDAGKAILAEGEDQLEDLLKDFVRSFDRFGRAASEVYRKKAQLSAMVIGIVLALGANVDAGRLFSTLMENPDVRVDLIEQASDANDANQEAIKRLKALELQIANNELVGNQSTAIKNSLDGVKTAVSATMEDLSGQGLPIGHDYFPYCNTANTDDLCSSPPTFKEDRLLYLKWILLCVVSGVLIGLGGPFWFRVFSSLSQVFQVLRALGVGSKQQAKPEEVAQSAETETSAKPGDVFDAFKTAAYVHRQSTTQRTRALLGPDGHTL